MITLFIIIVLGFIIYKAIVNPSDKPVGGINLVHT